MKKTIPVIAVMAVVIFGMCYSGCMPLLGRGPDGSSSSDLKSRSLRNGTSENNGSEELTTLFGPRVFLRGTGEPFIEKAQFSSQGFQSPFILHVRNGEENGAQRVSSAEVHLNGLSLFGPADFSQQVPGHDVEVELTDPNILEVKLNSAPGSKLVIWVEGKKEEPPQPEGSISGTVTDWVTGDPISGARIVFGSYSATTDALGAYRIDTAPGVSTIDGFFAVFKGTSYSFYAASGIAADPRTYPKYDFKLWPANTSLYHVITISGKAYFSDGVTEIPNGSEVLFEIFNSKGGYSKIGTSYDNTNGTGYSCTSKTYASECFVRVRITPGGGTPFEYYLDHQPLEELTNVTLNLRQPQSSAYTSVNLYGTAGTFFMGQLVMPGFGALEQYTTGMFFNGSTTANIYNPSAYPMNWWTVVMVPFPPGPGDNTMKIHSSEVIPFSDSFILPSMATATGPTQAVDVMNTASWDGSTLSFSPVDGANFYMTTLIANNGRMGRIWMTTPSITFPAEFATDVLKVGEGWDVLVWPAWSPDALSLDFFSKMVPGGAPVGLDFEVVVVQATPTGNGYKVDVIP